MRLPLVVFISFSITAFAAQPAAAPKKTEEAVKPKVVEAAPTPAPKRSVFGRMFGGKPKPTPTPAPTPAPVVKPKPKPKARPKAAATPEEPAPAETAKPTEATTPPAPTKPETDTAKPAVETAPPAPKPGKTGKSASKPKAPEAPALDDDTKYKNARTTALADEQIKELKTKADSAVDEEEAHRASVAYNKALFRKIRQVDPSLDAYVDPIEAAMMKRLTAEKRN